MVTHILWIGIQRYGNNWYQLNGDIISPLIADWAPGEPVAKGNCAVADKSLE